MELKIELGERAYPIAIGKGAFAAFAREMDALCAFRARGGKLVVFYSSSPALGELMGVRPLGYVAWPRPRILIYVGHDLPPPNPVELRPIADTHDRL